jgi:hypothetical protein
MRRAKTKDPMTVRCWKVWREPTKNAARKSYTIARGMRAGFQPRTSICKERDNNLTGNDRLIMERWKEYFFYETLNSKDDVKIREEVIYQGP